MFPKSTATGKGAKGPKTLSPKIKIEGEENMLDSDEEYDDENVLPPQQLKMNVGPNGIEGGIRLVFMSTLCQYRLAQVAALFNIF